MAGIDFESLLLLLNAKSKSDVESILKSCIDLNYMSISVPKFIIINTKQLINCENDLLVIKLIRSASKLVYLSLKLNEISNESLSQLFPNSFHKQLKTLLIKIIIENSNNWLLTIEKPIQSMPSLINFKCETNSSKCLIDFRLNINRNQLFEEEVSLILSKEQLKDVTKGMSLIRQQLFEANNK